MTQPTSPTHTLADYITSHRLDAELLAPGVPMPTVSLAAAAIGAREDQILKTLLCEDRADRHVIAIASGLTKVDRSLLAAIAGLDRPRLADPTVVLALTGHPAGGVPPIAHRTPLPVLIDRAAADLEVAYGGGGDEQLLLRIRPVDIIRLTDALVADFVSRPAPSSEART